MSCCESDPSVQSSRRIKVRRIIAIYFFLLRGNDYRSYLCENHVPRDLNIEYL